MIMEEWVRLICVKCNTKLKIQEEHTGKRGKCPKCQHRFPIEEEIKIIEDDFDIEADMMAEFAAIDADMDKKAKKKKKDSTLQVVEHNGWQDEESIIDMKELGFDN